MISELEPFTKTTPKSAAATWPEASDPELARAAEGEDCASRAPSRLHIMRKSPKSILVTALWCMVRNSFHCAEPSRTSLPLCYADTCAPSPRGTYSEHTH